MNDSRLDLYFAIRYVSSEWIGINTSCLCFFRKEVNERMKSKGDFAGGGYKKKSFEYFERELKANPCLSAVVTAMPFLPKLLTAISAFGLFAVVINAVMKSQTLIRDRSHISLIV